MSDGEIRKRNRLRSRRLIGFGPWLPVVVLSDQPFIFLFFFSFLSDDDDGHGDLISVKSTSKKAALNVGSQ